LRTVYQMSGTALPLTVEISVTLSVAWPGRALLLT
jgi:hypothetical protein